MSSENQLRLALETAINNVLKYPRPSERDAILMDAMLFIAERLRVTVEYPAISSPPKEDDQTAPL